MSASTSKYHRTALLFGIPIDKDYTAKEIVNVLNNIGFECDVKLFLENDKPFYKGTVIFSSARKLIKAASFHRKIKLREYE